MTMVDSQVHRFTRAEYDQMASLGLFADKRVELIAGEILDMPPQTNPHVLTITILNRFFTRHLGDEFMVRCQSPLAIADDYAPEPDFAVLHARVEDMKEHPSTALFVVEVACDSLRRDRKKAALYAQAGVQEYWIINVEGREIIQHTGPRPASGTNGDFQAKYATIRTYAATETIACTVLPLPPRQVDQFLPPF
jgi:Uma2 family endonuclease